MAWEWGLDVILVHVQSVKFEDTREHLPAVYGHDGRVIGRTAARHDPFITLDMRMLVSREDAPKFINHVATFYMMEDPPRCFVHEGCIRSKEVGEACYATAKIQAKNNPDLDMDDKAQDTVDVLKATRRIE